ncbi:MAG TPA: xanthine dehydrogenase family protein molybdopterin-binding subunit [Novosphingobium sp.]|nr:xanthine dehydrogenase family protein molybdopterin-binding subunit [Novosphingobium sp.]
MNDPAPTVGARFVGQRVQRKEDGRLLIGKGTYIDDVVVSGMLHAAFVRSTVARGRITRLDVSAAQALPGVFAVLTAGEIDKLGARYFNAAMDQPDLVYPDNGLLCRKDVRFVGDPVAIVLADSRALAEDGAALVEVDYAVDPPVVGIAAARTMPPVHPEYESNSVGAMEMTIGEDIDGIFASAAHVVEDEIVNCRQTPVPMEPRGLLARREGSGELTINIATQGPHMTANHIAGIFGLSINSIRILAKDVGGGFGQKVTALRDELAVVAAALLIDRPIKWIEDRLENLTAASQSRDETCRVRLAFDSDHRLLAADVDFNIDYGAYPHAVHGSGGLTFMMLPGPYRLPAYRFRSSGWFTNTCGEAPYRGPWMMDMFARETMLDTAARQMGVDPIELRRKNIISKADQPFTMVTGMVIDDVTPAETMEAVVAAVDIPAFRREQEAARKEGRYLGLGIAVAIEPTAIAMGTYTSEVAHVRVEPNGKVTAMMSTFSQGHGTPTTMAQIVADRLGVPFGDVTVVEGDSTRTGYGSGAGGSRQAIVGGGAARVATDMLADKIKAIAAHAFNGTPEDVLIDEGIVTIKGSETRATLAEIAQMAYFDTDRLPHGMETGLETQYRFRAPPMVFANQAHAAVVEVDIETGKTKVLRWVAGGDCGNLINPAIVEGQISGGVVQGIAGVLFEKVSYDENGQPLAATFKDYLVPTALDVPRLEYVHLCTPSITPGGFKGVGEGGAMISPPTLVNAINDALAPFGKNWLNMPITPDRVVIGLAEAMGDS